MPLALHLMGESDLALSAVADTLCVAQSTLPIREFRVLEAQMKKLSEDIADNAVPQNKQRTPKRPAANASALEDDYIRIWADVQTTWRATLRLKAAGPQREAERIEKAADTFRLLEEAHECCLCFPLGCVPRPSPNRRCFWCTISIHSRVEPPLNNARLGILATGSVHSSWKGFENLFCVIDCQYKEKNA